jgi:hypothetical protein
VFERREALPTTSPPGGRPQIFAVYASAMFALACAVIAFPPVHAQGSARPQDHPAIRYDSTPPADAVERLNAHLDAGFARLTFQGRSGYLKSALDALGIGTDSQLLVFSGASFQARRISESNPRAIFFKDDVELGWVRDGDVIEVAAQDEKLGTVFYTLEQKPSPAPRFKRAFVCLGCHLAPGTGEIPGLVLFSSIPFEGRPSGVVDYMKPSMPMTERFGGWFVTGALLPSDHRGNGVQALGGRSRVITTTTGLFPSDGYLSATSDIAAMLVLTHQVETVNAVIRASWKGRRYEWATQHGGPANAADDGAQLRTAATEVVDRLLFVGDAAFDAPLKGTSGFAERFAAEGPHDAKGRSLRDLDLRTRLTRYPCSYLIYSPLFDGMPATMKDLVYARLWQVLSGSETASQYRRALTPGDRRAVVDILRTTKPGLPAYFSGAVR